MFPWLANLPFMFARGLPPDTASGILSRDKYAQNRQNAIRGFTNGQPAPGQELGANLPTTPALFRQFAGASGAPSFDEAGFMPPKPASGAQSFDEAGFNPPSAPPPAAGASPAAASASPSPSPGLPVPQAPAGAGGAGGFNPPLPPAFSRALPSFYNGPGSMNFGATEQVPGLMDLFKGGTAASNAVQRAPDKLGWNALRFLTNNGKSFAPGWTASDAPYNN